MKSIKSLLILSLIYQLTYLQARPGGVAGGRSGIGNTNRVGNNTTQKAALGGAAAINKNNNQDLAATALSSTENQSNETTDTTTQTTNPQSAVPIQTQQDDTIPTEPVAINPPEITPSTNIIAPIESINSNSAQKKVVAPEEIQILSEPQPSAEHTQKAEAQDQENILKTLKAIDIQDAHNKMLLTQSSMDQLFNNFIYFKSFIVENFTKEKMLHLCVEFIDQIYPKETVIAANILKETSQASSKNSNESDSSQNIKEEPSNIQTEVQSNMVTNEPIDNSEQNYQNDVNEESEEENNQ